MATARPKQENILSQPQNVLKIMLSHNIIKTRSNFIFYSAVLFCLRLFALHATFCPLRVPHPHPTQNCATVVHCSTRFNYFQFNGFGSLSAFCLVCLSLSLIGAVSLESFSLLLYGDCTEQACGNNGRCPVSPSTILQPKGVYRQSDGKWKLPSSWHIVVGEMVKSRSIFASFF